MEKLQNLFITIWVFSIKYEIQSIQINHSIDKRFKLLKHLFLIYNEQMDTFVIQTR